MTRRYGERSFIPISVFFHFSCYLICLEELDMKDEDLIEFEMKLKDVAKKEYKSADGAIWKQLFRQKCTY